LESVNNIASAGADAPDSQRFSVGGNACDGLSSFIKLLPQTAELSEGLRGFTGARRWGWNRAKEIWETMEAAARAFPPGSDERLEAWPTVGTVRAALAEMVRDNPDFEWARKVDSKIFQEVVTDFAKAKGKNAKEARRVRAARAAGQKAKFDRKCMPPRFRRKGRKRDSYRTANDRVKFRKVGGRCQIWLPLIGWVNLAEEPPRLGKLMSVTVTRHGDDFFVSLAFQRLTVKTKRNHRDPDYVRKTPAMVPPEASLRLPIHVNGRRRTLTPVSDVAALIEAAKPEDVVGGDRGQRTLITLSRPVRIVRGVSDRAVLSDATVVACEPIGKPAAPPAAKGVRTVGKAVRTKARQGRKPACFVKMTETGTQFIPPKPLRKAKSKLRKLQRRRSRAALIPLPAPSSETAPPSPGKTARNEAKKVLRARKRSAPKATRKAIRRAVAEKDREKRRECRKRGAARRAEAEKARRALAAERKALRKAGKDDEANRLAGTKRTPRKSARGRRLVAKVTKTHADVRNIRDDVQHKVTTAITGQVRVLCLDRVPGNGGFGADDAALAGMRQKLGYKAALDGCLIIDAYRFFPSSKRCSGCGHIHAGLKRGDTNWVCPSCRKAHDRDVNAAHNLAWYGRIALSILKGGDVAQIALAGLTAIERSWFSVGRANAEPPFGGTRGETDAAPSGVQSLRAAKKKSGGKC
jgi:putative transposase